MERLTSSVEASLVSHLAPQENAKEVTTQDTSGPTSPEVSESWGDLPLFSLKTSKASSVLNSKATIGATPKVHQFCSMSLESWKGWVTKQRQAYSQRLKSAHHTKENECLFLVSEMISGRTVLILSDQISKTLQVDAVQLTQKDEEQINTYLSHQGLSWNTPQARDYKGVDRRKEIRGFSPYLPNQVRWTTPIARDCFEIEMNFQIPTRKDGKHRLDTMPRQIHHQEGYRGKLNPRWVETLMGIPVGWTMPSCMNPVTIAQTNSECWEMESCQTPPQQPSSPCGETWPTPTARDWKGPQSPRFKDRGYGALLPDEVKTLNWTTPATSQRGDNVTYYLSKNKKRISNGKGIFPTHLQVEVEAQEKGIDLKAELKDFQDRRDAFKSYPEKEQNWPTPPASQRGEDLKTYIKKTKKRVSEGGTPFAPTLQVAVEAAQNRTTPEEALRLELNRERKLFSDHPELMNESILLPKEFDKCILTVDKGRVHYAQDCVLCVIGEERLKDVLNGDLTCHEQTPKESSRFHPVEWFDSNIAGAYMGEYTPVYVVEEEEEEI